MQICMHFLLGILLTGLSAFLSCRGSYSLVQPEKNKKKHNREYLGPQIRNMNNWFHSEAKLPWSYDYPLANHIATNRKLHQS